MVRHRGRPGRDGGSDRHRAALAGRVAGGPRGGRGRGDGPGPAQSVGRREPEARPARESWTRAGAGGLRVRRCGLGDLPGRGPRPRPRAQHDRRQGGVGAVHRRLRGGRGHFRAGAVALPRIGHALRLRLAGGARRTAAHLRQPDDPGHPDGRIAPAAGRVAPQDDEPDQRGNLHRVRRGPGARGVRARPGLRVDCRLAARASCRHPGRGVGNSVGVNLAAEPLGRAGAGTGPRGAGQSRR